MKKIPRKVLIEQLLKKEPHHSYDCPAKRGLDSECCCGWVQIRNSIEKEIGGMGGWSP